jgi:hypothetical protein
MRNYKAVLKKMNCKGRDFIKAILHKENKNGCHGVL